MQILAAINVDSNAMRIMVGRIVYDGKVEVIENLHRPVRGRTAVKSGQNP